MGVTDAPINFLIQADKRLTRLCLQVRPGGASRSRKVVYIPIPPLRWCILNMLQPPQKDSLHHRPTPSTPMRPAMVFMGLSPRVKPRALRCAEHVVDWWLRVLFRLRSPTKVYAGRRIKFAIKKFQDFLGTCWISALSHEASWQSAENLELFPVKPLKIE